VEQQIAGLRAGDHVCLLYEDRAGQRSAVAAFLAAGLARGQRCVFVADESTLEEVGQALEAAGIAVAREQERGALRLLTKRDCYLADGEFRPAAMVDLLRREEAQAIADGFAGAWLTGDMTWALGREPGCDRLIE
jgi:hypothetical protein